MPEKGGACVDIGHVGNVVNRAAAMLVAVERVRSQGLWVCAGSDVVKKVC